MSNSNLPLPQYSKYSGGTSKVNICFLPSSTAYFLLVALLMGSVITPCCYLPWWQMETPSPKQQVPWLFSSIHPTKKLIAYYFLGRFFQMNHRTMRHEHIWKNFKKKAVFEVKLSSLTESEFSVKSMHYLGSKELTNMQRGNAECHQFVHMLFI